MMALWDAPQEILVDSEERKFASLLLKVGLERLKV